MSEQTTSERYEQACEREAYGEPLAASELELMRSYEAEHPQARRERELWAAAIEQLRARGEDPRLQAGLDRLGESILAQRRAEQEARPRAKWIGYGLALAAGVALVILGVRLLSSDADEPERPKMVVDQPERPDQPTPAIEPDERSAIVEQPSIGASPSSARAVVSLVAGEVSVTEAPVLAAGHVLEPGGKLEAAFGSQACLRWEQPFAVVCVDAGAELYLPVELAEGERRLWLTRGRLVAVLDPLPPGQRFVVESFTGSVTAVGTVFVVEVGAGSSRHSVGERGTIEAAVLEGVVEVRHQSKVEQPAWVERLVAGQAIDMTRPEAVVVAMPERTRERASFVASVAELWKVGAEEREIVARVDTSPQPDEAPEPGTRTEPSKRKPSPSAAKLAELAQQNRRARNYGETARLYRELIERYPDSLEAANAPIRLGDVLLSIGDPDGALAAYELYLERGGQLAPEARLGRIEALRTLGRSDEEREAIEEFLREHPDDYRSAELKDQLR